MYILLKGKVSESLLRKVKGLKVLKELKIAWLHKRGGDLYGKEKNEIMEEDITCSVSSICSVYNTCIKKIYNYNKPYKCI